MQNIVQNVYLSLDSLEKRPHFHDCHQIILVVDGIVEFGINGEKLRAVAGDAVIFSRYENHSVHVLSDSYSRYVLHIEPDIINSDSQVYSLLTDRPIGFCNVIHVSQYADVIEGIFEQLLREQNERERLQGEMESCLVKQLLIMIHRCVQSHYSLASDDMVVKIKRQFENNCGVPYSLQQLAKQYSVSVSALSHRFRTVTGMSVMKYLSSCRMASAKSMLVATGLDIGQIVEECGFSDANNFARTFKKINGMTPSAFREKYKSR